MTQNATLAERAENDGAPGALVADIARLEALHASALQRLQMITDPKHAKLVEIDDTGMTLMSPLLVVLFEGVTQLLRESGAEKYIEMAFDSDDFGPLMLTIQKRMNKSPHDFRGEAEARLDNLRAGVDALQTAYKTYRTAIEAAQAEGQSSDEMIATDEAADVAGDAFFDAVEAL